MGNYLYIGYGPIIIPASLCSFALRGLQQGGPYSRRGEELETATDLAQGLRAFNYIGYFAPDGDLVFVEQMYDLKDSWGRSLETAFDNLTLYSSYGSYLEVLDEGYGNTFWKQLSAREGGVREELPHARALACAAAVALLIHGELAADTDAAKQALELSAWARARALVESGLADWAEELDLYVNLEDAELDRFFSDASRYQSVVEAAPEAAAIIARVVELADATLPSTPDNVDADGRPVFRLLRAARGFLRLAQPIL